MLDLGADVDYVDVALVDNMRANNLIINCVNCFTCSGVQACHPIPGLINLTISYNNELGQKYSITIKAHLVKNLSYSLIIGRETIRKYNLILQFPKHFLNLQSLPRYWDFQASRGCGYTAAAVTGRVALDVGKQGTENVPEEKLHSACAVCSSPAIDAAASSRQSQVEETLLSASLASGLPLDTSLSNSNIFSLNSLNRSIRSDFEKEDIHEIRDDQMEAIPSEMLGFSASDDELPKEIHGPPSLQAKLRTLILEYKDIFSRKVR